MARPPKQELSSAAQDLLRSGHKIEAIKLIRGETGLGLKEAKDLAEAWEPHLARAAGAFGRDTAGLNAMNDPSGLAPGEQPRSSTDKRLWIGALAAIAGAVVVALLLKR